MGCLLLRAWKEGIGDAQRCPKVMHDPMLCAAVCSASHQPPTISPTGMRRLATPLLLAPMVLLAFVLRGARALRAVPPAARRSFAAGARRPLGCGRVGGRPPQRPATRVLAAGFETYDYADVQLDARDELFLLDGTAM